eukprot:COSAG02_NODE_997_length_15333_cov_13.688526_17_plen_173_part_00
MNSGKRAESGGSRPWVPAWTCRPRFASTKWLPVAREMVQWRAVADGRKVSDAHAKRYLSETTLRKSLIVIGAPTAADIVHHYNVEGEAEWSAAKAADVHAKLATAKSSAGATSNAFVTAIIGAVMHCDEKLLACHGRATDGTQRGTKRKARGSITPEIGITAGFRNISDHPF